MFGWCAYLCRICSFNLVAGRSGGRGIWRVLDISGRVNLSGGGNDPTPIQGAARAHSHLAGCWLSVNDLQLQMFGCVRPKIGRAHVRTADTNPHLVCRYLHEKKPKEDKHVSTHTSKANHTQL